MLNLCMDAWIAIGTVVGMFATLLLTKLRPDAVFYGPGDYRFGGFVRIGLPMNFIILAANIFIVNIVYPLSPLSP